jgi:hypothetical protein
VDLRDRSSAVEWGRAEAARIVDGAYDDEQLGVFNAAQRMENVLTRWTWTTEDFPPAIADFVFGWNVSGPNTDAEIRDAALELTRDRSPNGPPLPPRYELD